MGRQEGIREFKGAFEAGRAGGAAGQWGKVGGPPKQQCQPVPRHSLAHYGLTGDRVEELKWLIQSGRHAPLALQAAHEADNGLAEHILLSITKNLIFDVKLKGIGK